MLNGNVREYGGWNCLKDDEKEEGECDKDTMDRCWNSGQSATLTGNRMTKVCESSGSGSGSRIGEEATPVQWIITRFHTPVRLHMLALTFQGGFVGTVTS